MNLNEAITKHAEWKLRFRRAIAGHETMDAETISKDNCCDLGKWLYGEAKEALGKHQFYEDCVKSHAAFHKEAGRVAQLINTKKFAEAEVALGNEMPYFSASQAVSLAVMKLKKEANL